ncbi:MAG: rhodanese-like domain-containing protein [Betaproteobacteria bacterium]
MIRRVPAPVVRKQLQDGAELALLDVREQGVHSRGHPFFACSLPLSHLESRVRALVPRCSVPVVLIDEQDEGLARRAAARLSALGYTDIGILENGCAGWKAGGGELFTGVNVPSKAFGEFVEHHYRTPHISAAELRALLDRNERLVILDSRPFEEYHRMNIPTGIDVPGAELAFRVHDLAPDPGTLVVVNCAGRTRSIIGCQSLRNAGIPNRVVALKDGTMGWELAGFSCEQGSDRTASAPSPNGRARGLECAARVARRFGVQYAPTQRVRAWADDPTRTLFLLDVRTRSEFERAHIAGSRHAPGGQLVQATDEFVGVRNARVVLIDPEQVRAVMTASWLGQMGWDDVHVLEPEGRDGFDGWTVAHGPEAGTGPRPDPWPTIGPAALADRMKTADITVVDLSTSLAFRSRHIPGAWWAVRARLDQAREQLPDVRTLVLTSRDGSQARWAAAEAQDHWPDAQVLVLDGGNEAWQAATYAMAGGMERTTTAPDDVWYRPYEQEDYARHARDYLSWEVALVEQVKRDPSIRFRTPM